MEDYCLIQERRINGILTREYAARDDGEPVDRFMVFQAGSVWFAWTSDTISEAAKARRVRFALQVKR